jgi:hypothetical protein
MGEFQVQVSPESGGTIQEFHHGAMIHLPEDPSLPVSFIHVTDINISYTLRNGWPIVDSDGQDNLPRFSVADTQKAVISKELSKKFPTNPAVKIDYR